MYYLQVNHSKNEYFRRKVFFGNIFKVSNSIVLMNKVKKFFLGLLLGIFSFPFVRAQYLPGPEEVINSVIRAVENIFTPIFSALLGQNSSEEFLLAKILLAILLFVVINAVLKKIPTFSGQKGVVNIISVVISFLAVRFISDNDLVAGILLPYGTLGVALTTILPFLIFFYFIHDSKIGSFGRKACWFFFIVVFVILWYSKSSDLSEITNQIYLWTLVGMIIAFIADRSVHEYFGLFEERKTRRNSYTASIARKEADLQHLVSSGSEDRNVLEQIEILRKQISRLKSERGYF